MNTKINSIPSLDQLPLKFSTITDVNSVFSYDTHGVCVNYYVLRPQEKKNS